MKSFWFALENPRPLALMRIIIGLAFLGDSLLHWPYVVELYSTDGLPMPFFSGTILHPPALAAEATVLLFAGLLFALTCVVFGWQTRLCLIVSVVLLTWTGLLDFAGTFKKYSVIGIHLLVLLAFTECGAVWSLDRLIDRYRGLPVRLGPAWPRRLMQILLCAVYLGAAVTKFHSNFASGDIVFFSLLEERWGAAYPGMWLVAHPKLLVLSSYATLLFESSFPLLVWVPRLRRPMLVAALLFHLSLGCLMTLAIFTPVMLAALCAFLEDRDLRLFGLRTVETSSASPRAESTAALSTVARWKWPAVSLFVWIASGSAIVALGYAQQRSSDLYGVFRGRAAEPLSPISAEKFEEMLDPRTPSSVDSIYRVELGERISAHHAFGENRRFRQGQKAVLLIRLIQPHPPIPIEIEFIDPMGKVSERFVRLADETNEYLPIEFLLTDDHTPGEYEVLVKSHGRIAVRKSFELLPGNE